MLDVQDKPVPHSIEAEQVVLGTLMIRESAWAEVSSDLVEDDFFRDAHRIIYRAMTRLYDQRVAIDFLTLKEELSAQELIDVGGLVYLASLVDDIVRLDMSHLASWVKIVQEKSRLRALISDGKQLILAAYLEDESSDEIAAAAVKRLFSTTATANKAVKLKTAVDRYMESLINETIEEPIGSGFHDLDSLIGGFNRGDLAILAARPSVGKSSLMLGSALRIAKHGVPTAVFSLEMKERMLAAQVVAWASGVRTDRIRRKTADAGEQQRVSDAWTKMDDHPLYIHDVAKTLTQVGAWCKRLKDQYGIQCVFIDYLQLLLTEGRRRTDSRENEVAGISKALKALAGDQNLAVIALSQLSRATEERKDKRPHLSDLRESGALEQDADLAILLFREWMHKQTDDNYGVAEVIVAKNRTGPTGVVKLYFREELAQFCDMART